MNVLIVEDDKSIARLLKPATSEAGYASQVAHDGQFALELARVNSYDLILLDVMVPRVDGFEVCRRPCAGFFGHVRFALYLCGFEALFKTVQLLLFGCGYAVLGHHEKTD